MPSHPHRHTRCGLAAGTFSAARFSALSLAGSPAAAHTSNARVAEERSATALAALAERAMAGILSADVPRQHLADQACMRDAIVSLVGSGVLAVRRPAAGPPARSRRYGRRSRHALVRGQARGPPSAGSVRVVKARHRIQLGRCRLGHRNCERLHPALAGCGRFHGHDHRRRRHPCMPFVRGCKRSIGSAPMKGTTNRFGPDGGNPDRRHRFDR